MDGTYSNKPDLWNAPGGVGLQDLFGFSEPEAERLQVSPPLAGPHAPAEFARRLFAYESLNPSPRNRRSGDDAEPYSLQWFLNVEAQRHSRHGKWIPKLLEFAKHSGETLLGLGHGLGTDWLQYARHGASVVICSPSRSQLGLVRRNFELRGLGGRFIHAHPACLPLDSASIDVACLSGLLEGVEQPQAVIDEVYRVLRPGGKVIAITPARYDIDFWYGTIFFWYRLLGFGRPRTALSFAGGELRALFGRFSEHRVHKRQLRRSEVPHVWRWLPLSFLSRLMGRMLILKAFKPLSAAIRCQRVAAA